MRTLLQMRGMRLAALGAVFVLLLSACSSDSSTATDESTDEVGSTADGGNDSDAEVLAMSSKRWWAMADSGPRPAPTTHHRRV